MDNIYDAGNGKTGNGKKGKKELRRSIAAKLEASLEEYRAGLKEKKFKAAVKRASKLLSNDLFVKSKKEKVKTGNSLTIVDEEIGA